MLNDQYARLGDVHHLVFKPEGILRAEALL
jgi:hypothetical protein